MALGPFCCRQPDEQRPRHEVLEARTWAMGSIGVYVVLTVGAFVGLAWASSQDMFTRGYVGTLFLSYGAGLLAIPLPVMVLYLIRLDMAIRKSRPEAASGTAAV